jgi:hypothetical protein
VNGQDNYGDNQHDVNYPADRFLQENKTQQPEHQQHASDNQEHLATPGEVFVELRQILFLLICGSCPLQVAAGGATCDST